MHLIKMHLFQVLPGRRKFLLRLARKAHDHVGGDGGIVKGFPQNPAALPVFLRVIVTVHPL